MFFPPTRWLTLASVLATAVAWAGGSGLNVIVVVNQNSANSLQLGNDYCEKRGVPPLNVFRMTGWTGGGTNWSRTDFEARLRQPLLAMLANRGLTNQGQFVLLSMDIPYRVFDGSSQNSTTSALYYGFKPNTNSPVPGYPSCSLPDYSFNSYVFSELAFPEAPPDTADTNSFLAMMLTDNTLAGAEFILNSGVASDSSYPTQAVYLAKTSDPNRNVRFVEFDNAMFDTHIRGDNSLIWLAGDSLSSTNVLGLMTGLANLNLPPGTFTPGALGDSLTSFGGYIFDMNGQTPLLAFLEAGAAGSYGTIIEPCNYLEKFPNPLDYFYQNRGFSVAESYYQSVQSPFQGLLVGEPLAAPFARRGAADWSSLADGSTLSGQVTLSPVFFAAATNLPLGQVDLFVDGMFIKTVTNLPPAAGNALSVTLNGFTVDYTVPTNATVASTVGDLASALNSQLNNTAVVAFPTGDRLEFESLLLNTPGSNVTATVSAGAGTAALLTTVLTPARPAFLDTSATGHLDVAVGHTPVVGDWLQFDFFKTNGAQVTVGVTNTSTNATAATLAQALVNQVNADPALQSPDGLAAGDLLDFGSEAQFTLYARSPGWPAAEIQAALTSSTNLLALPSGTNKLEDNLTDLRPRNHLYVSSGATNLTASFTLDTTLFPDGYHELSAVAYEGTSVRTQTRVTRKVFFQNTPLAATLTAALAGTNATVDFALQITVTANTNAISSIQLFSTGGVIGTASNQQTAVFAVSSAMLGLGLHPFYALVADNSGHQFRTQTAWIRLLPSMTLALTEPPFQLTWPAQPGLAYDILATTNLAQPFQAVASVTAFSPVAQWPIPLPVQPAAFYAVRLKP